MPLPKHFDARTTEAHLQAWWENTGTYHFADAADAPIYAIDTPPATVSGNLHLGHVYSYSHADLLARFWRMNGYTIFYPMGFDDNGLPTERLVEKQLGVTAAQVGRSAFIEQCLAVSDAAERDYKALWQRLGLSIDWRYTYRTIDTLSRRTSQHSFLDLYHKGLVYRHHAPTIWCPECKTAIAQAEVNDWQRDSQFVTVAFRSEQGDTLPIATTRAELLPACVAVFVHGDDPRYRSLVGRRVVVPLWEHTVPVMADPQADPGKGTGAVMCCTFGDTADVDWWRTHRLPLIEAIDRDGRLTNVAGAFAGLSVTAARQRIVETLRAQGLVLAEQPVTQSVRVHERCDTPVEYLVTQQWFVRVLPFKQAFLDAGEQITWHPPHMRARYREWVENLRWDWLISRQRSFGVPFPIWYCDACGAIMPADAAQLPIDPAEQPPSHACPCGSTSFTPERDVMDTWATSSMTPQIVGRWLAEPQVYRRVFPLSLRSQAHEIIRTWAFYTIVKSHHHFEQVPWKAVAISGWGLAPGGTAKISKSRGGGPMAPLAMIDRYGADAVRYWATSTGFGKDTVISEEKIQTGAKLVTKLWNVARFSERFFADDRVRAVPSDLVPTDRWILSRTQRLIRHVTALFHSYEYAAAKSEIETFFWNDVADNYLELAKQRLYDADHAQHRAACATLQEVLLTTVKLFAPFLPYVTEAIYQGLFVYDDVPVSLHRARWPVADESLEDDAAEAVGGAVVAVATAVRRYKSEHHLSLGTELQRVQITTQLRSHAAMLRASMIDLKSVTRAKEIEVVDRHDPSLDHQPEEHGVAVTVIP